MSAELATSRSICSIAVAEHHTHRHQGCMASAIISRGHPRRVGIKSVYPRHRRGDQDARQLQSNDISPRREPDCLAKV